jgi:hypothetical protein
MVAPELREKVIAVLDELTDEQVQELLHRIEVMRYVAAMNSTTLPENYSVENDPLVGFLSGTTDLAERVEDVLYPETSGAVTSNEGKR